MPKVKQTAVVHNPTPYEKLNLVAKPDPNDSHQVVCYCSEKANKKTSKEGKVYYGCMKSHYDKETAKYENGCKFFLWDTDLVDGEQLLCECGVPYKGNFWEKKESKREYFCVNKSKSCPTLVTK